jgi:hypothetical protein
MEEGSLDRFNKSLEIHLMMILMRSINLMMKTDFITL